SVNSGRQHRKAGPLMVYLSPGARNSGRYRALLLSVKRAIACGVAVLLCLANLWAASSNIADAAMKKDAAAVRLLLQQRADVNAAQADGATALHWAVHWDDQETVDLLIQAGANVNASNEYGATPLFLAASKGSSAMSEKLQRAGANHNAALLAGEPALMTALHTGSVDLVKSRLAH